ncbi:MAG: RnfABCDGE type electron transport complex subunit D, partial [Flavobacteriales bacterium]
IDTFTGATPLGDLAGLIKLDTASDQVDAIMAKVPGIMDCFYGWIPGSVGETSALACIIGAAVLLFTGIASWRVIFSMFAGGLCMALLFNLWDANPFMAVNPIHQLMLGGFMFGAVFMATDPVTAAQTNTGKLIYGFLAGLLAIMIRVFNPAYPEGVMMAILFMNVMAPLIDHYVIQSNIKRRMKRLKTAQAA